MNDESLQRLLQLKRYEQPPEGYYEDFLREFHHRQRAELLKPSLRTLVMERIGSWISEFRVPTYAYAGATAMAVIASVAVLNMNTGTKSGHTTTTLAAYSPAAYSSTYTQNPITIEKMQPVSLRGDTSAMDSQIFPTSYSLQAHPASHESPLSF